jgi:N-acetylmuramoyl-L-alanine amidase
MIAALFALTLLGNAPSSVVISTPAGERRIPVTMEPGTGPLIPAGATLTALRGTSASDGVWAEVTVGSAPFRFLLGAPVYTFSGEVFGLSSSALVRRDTLFLPLTFLSDALPRHLATRFRWDGKANRLTDAGDKDSRLATRDSRPSARPPITHRVVLDAGHGGVDPGNPGLFFPNGLREKDVNLQMAMLVREELRAQGVQVTMTRARDTLIDLRDRSRYCGESCDLFVSLHVNSLARRAGYTSVNGFETYILGEAKTEDAERVAQMENEAIRFEQTSSESASSGLDFILKDLQINEHLRESARVAELVQQHVGAVHTGSDKGVKQGNFMVLNTAQRPAILFEMGYSTNRSDARMMTDPTAQRRLARAIASAILTYLAEYERRSDAGSASGSGPSGS